MGIKFLDKILTVAGNKKLILTCNEEVKNIFGGKQINSCNCHIDFSIFLHKLLMVVQNMETALLLIDVFINCLIKHKNTVFIHIDPKVNIRKQLLQHNRYLNKMKQVEIKKQKLIQNTNGYKYKQYVNELVNQTNNDVSYETYLKHLEDYKTNDIIYIDYDNVENIENISAYKKNYSQTQKNVFSLFVYQYKFVYHHEYILEHIMNKFNQLIVIKSEYLDAEINIIDYILKNKMNNNILFTCDQDTILFGLYHLNNNYIYIKSDFTTLTESITLYKKNNLNLNLCYLVLFFNISDYFDGIAGFKLTDYKIQSIMIKTPLKTLLKKKYNSKISLIATFLQFFKKKTEQCDDKTISYIDLYFNELDKYLNISKDFYTRNNDIFIEKIHIRQLLEYLNIKKPIYKTIVDNNIIEINWP